MARTPNDEKSREAEARRAGMRIVIRDGVRVEPAPADGPAETAPAAPAAARGPERRDDNPGRDAIEEALRRYAKQRGAERGSKPTTDEELRRLQREHLEKVRTRRRGGSARAVDCRHNQCKLCRGTGVQDNGEPCTHMIACGCARCNPARPTLLATNGTC